jgi:hypothetical protein
MCRFRSLCSLDLERFSDRLLEVNRVVIWLTNPQGKVVELEVNPANLQKIWYQSEDCRKAKEADDKYKERDADNGKMPEWVPVYPGSSPKLAPGGSNGAGEAMFSFTTKDPQGRVFLYYQAALEDGGFDVDLTARSAAARTMTAQDRTKEA